SRDLRSRWGIRSRGRPDDPDVHPAARRDGPKALCNSPAMPKIDPASFDSIPPGLRYRLAEVQELIAAASSYAPERLARLYEDGEPWLGAAPVLAELGYDLLGKDDPELRQRGCVWLTLFPSV